MPTPTRLVFSVVGTQLTFRASLTDDNPVVLGLVRNALPLKSVLGHVVVAGETFWMPTRIISLRSGNMVNREVGSVYLHSAGTTICVCYGQITETAKVNTFGRVLEEDLDNLKAVGRLIYQQTVENEEKAILRIDVSLIAGDVDESANVPKPLHPHAPLAEAPWRLVNARIQEETEKAWLEEPNEFRKLRLGVVDSRAGTGKQTLSVLVHLKAFLLADSSEILFRVLQFAEDETTTTHNAVNLTRIILDKTFNHFAFFEDLGLPTLRQLGDAYIDSLDTITNKAEYAELTSSLLVYLTRTQHWLHLIFPWHLGKFCPHRKPEEIEGLPKLPIYSALTK